MNVRKKKHISRASKYRWAIITYLTDPLEQPAEEEGAGQQVLHRRLYQVTCSGRGDSNQIATGAHAVPGPNLLATRAA